MKKTMKLVALSLVLVIAMMSLVSCFDKSGTYRAAFEDEGYSIKTTEYDDLNFIEKGLIVSVLGEEYTENIDELDIIACSKDLNYAFIVVFESSSDLKKALTDDDDTDLYDDLVDEGCISGNCLLITSSDNALLIFKNA